MLFHCLLICIISCEKSHHYNVPLYKCLFSLAAFKIFLITDFEPFDYDVPWYYFLHVSCALLIPIKILPSWIFFFF